MRRSIKKLIDIIKEIYGVLDKSDRRKSYFVLFDILLCAILETASVGIIVPFMTVISSPSKITSNKQLSFIISFFQLSQMQLIFLLGGLIVLFYIIKNLFLMYSSYLQNKFRFVLQKKLSVKMLNAYMRKPYQFFVDNNSSVVVRGIGSDVGCVKDALGTLFELVTQLLTLVLIALFLAYTDFSMAIGLFAISLVCMYLLVNVLRKRISALGRQQREADKKVTKYTFEILEGVKEILALRKQNKFINMYDKAFGEKSQIEAKYQTYISFPTRVIETVFMTGIIGILFIRISQGIEINDFVPQLAVFAVGAIKMLPAMASVSKAATAIIFQKPGVDEAYSNISELKNEKQEHELETLKYEKTSFESLELNDIHWHFNGMDRDVIDGVSLEINRGESIAFIGASGAGKTTLIDIILGLFTPQSGQIKVNGIPISECPSMWSNMLAYVQQSIFLTDDTLRNNVAFGIDENEINDERIWEALEQAQLSDYVNGLDQKLDTIVGERGVKFSGGQRQRVAIARALYIGSDVIIFDEATAALDNETEKSLIESIEALHGEKTLIIVAHRLSTVKNCDRIYEIVGGKAVERDKKSLF